VVDNPNDHTTEKNPRNIKACPCSSRASSGGTYANVATTAKLVAHKSRHIADRLRMVRRGFDARSNQTRNYRLTRNTWPSSCRTEDASRKLGTVRRHVASMAVSHPSRAASLRPRPSCAVLRIRRRTLAECARCSSSKFDLFRDVVEEAADRHDAAWLALGVASGCRRSEPAGLDWAQRGTGSGVRTLTEEGATIAVFISKTSRGGEVESVYLQPGLALRVRARGRGRRT